jgi:hypothetical protein
MEKRAMPGRKILIVDAMLSRNFIARNLVEKK